jgi:arylsulfatase A-like enzyme
MVLVVDTLRADRVRSYGGPRETTPAIDRVAADGVSFEHAFTVAPSTWQSFVSILTGLNPPRHGVRFIFDEPLVPTIPSLGSTLGEQGYSTVAYDVAGFLRGMTGGHGFESYVDSDSVQKPCGITDAELTDQVLRWLGSRPTDRPFFAFVRYIGPHWKYEPKPEFHDLFGKDDGVEHTFNEGDHGVHMVTENGQPQLRLTDPAARRRLIFGALPPPVLDHMILHYDAAVRTVDEQVGRVIDVLRKTKLLDQTLLIITADHGEGLGERGYFQHGPRVDDGVMRVPLIMRFPRQAPHGRRGQRVAQLVRTIDIMPTVLETLGIPVPDGVQGRSLLPAIDGNANLELTAYGESAGEFAEVDDQTVSATVAGRQRMLRTARWKLVYVPDRGTGVFHLYDMASQGESEDVAAAHPDMVADMRASLAAILAADPDSIDGGLPPPSLTDDQRQRLRALGYL